MIIGLVLAALAGYFVRDFPYGYPLSFVLAVLLAAQGASVGLTKRAEITSLFFGGARPETDNHRMPAPLLDPPAIIHGRTLDIPKTGFLAIRALVLSSLL